MKAPAYRPFNCQRCSQVCARIGATQRYCGQCGYQVKLEGNRRRNAKYEASRPPRVRNSPLDDARQKRWVENNQERRLAQVRAYNDRNRELINQKSRERRELEHVKEQRREIDRKYRASPKQRVDNRMKVGISQALKGRKAGRSWEALVGYSLHQLIDHLERQFLPGMAWENIGKWHIDHVRPKVAFKYQEANDPDFRACWALTNLRPLWAKDNHSKHARLTHLL